MVFGVVWYGIGRSFLCSSGLELRLCIVSLHSTIAIEVLILRYIFFTNHFVRIFLAF